MFCKISRGVGSLNKVESIISELMEQRDAIDQAIAALRGVGGASAAAPAKRKRTASRKEDSWRQEEHEP